MNTKIRWLRDKIRLLDMQGMIVSNPVNIKYLTNIDAEGVLLITRKENIFITDGRYIEVANSTVTIDDEIIVCNIKDISKDDYENFFNYCENVGFEENYITYAEYKEYIHKYKINNFEETESIIEKQRMIKDEEEIRNLYSDGMNQFTENTVTDIEELLEIVKKAKINKFAEEFGEVTSDACCIAVPIIINNKINAAIGVSLPIFRANQEEILKIKNLLKEHSLSISKELENLNIKSII